MTQSIRKKVLVTGGAGFLGSYVCERLIAQNAMVYCLDNFGSGSSANIAHLIPHESFQLVEQDIIDPFDFDVDEIYNLACPASPRFYQKDPIHTTKTCVLGALNILELAKKYNARVLQASTSEVYGDPLEHPQTESYWGHVNPTGVRACYDEGKRLAETLFSDYARQYNLNIKIVRIFNTYGPRMHQNDGRVVSNFIVQALAGEDITVFGDGTQTRSFCYVDDLVDGFFAMMASSDDIQGPINLGNPIEFTIAQLAELVLCKIGGPSKLVYNDLPQDDPKQRRPTIDLAADILGWRPTTDLDAGLDKTIAYFSGLLGNYNAVDFNKT